MFSRVFSTRSLISCSSSLKRAPIQVNRFSSFSSINSNKVGLTNNYSYFRKETFPGRDGDVNLNNPHLGLLGFMGASFFLLALFFEREKTKCEDNEVSETNEHQVINVGSFRKDLPTFTLEEIEKHKTLETGVWVYYKEGVYDITEFIESHPGGLSKIMLAAGGDIEIYWQMYAQHLTQEVGDILEAFRIGNLKREKKPQSSDEIEGPYSKEPWDQRSKIFKVNTRTPFNSEPPLETLTDYLTPNELFFIRNHLPVPHIKPEEYLLEIVHEDSRLHSKLTLDDLKSLFREHKVVSTIQCAGNRRSEQNEIKKVRGLEWTGGAISNAEWKGVLLTDVLRHSAKINGIPDNVIEDYFRVKYHHVQFEGADKDVTSAVYGASIPLDKAITPSNEVLLAYEMNGKPLPLDHGYPIRVVVPGVVGARNVKWLNKIVLSKNESQSHWQQKDYKSFNSSVDWDTVDFTTMPAIQELPINSAISDPPNNSLLPHSVLDDGELTVKGFAYSGGGRAVIRVDVSVDEGKTWINAHLNQPVQSSEELTKRWSWTQWEATVPIDPSKKKMNIICKAIDSSYNNQPETVGPIWNLRGVLNNSWHRVQVEIPEKRE